jgi:hypothetical protein
MLTHLVLFRPRTDLPSSERERLAESLAAAIRDIPSVRSARVGRRVTHGRPYEQLMTEDYRYAALLEFDDLDGLKEYLNHPVHEELARLFFESFERALFYDYELSEGEAAVRKLL